jgi:RimJ/RimL family protein N-acetyltransferase
MRQLAHVTDSFLPRIKRNVRLRRLRPDDVDDFHAYRSDPELARYQGWSAMSRTQAAAFISTMDRVPLFPLGEWFQLAVSDVTTDRLVGDVGLRLYSDASAVEIGFTICRPAQGRGMATAAAEAAMELCWDCTSARAVIGITDARNEPSISVLRRLGMRSIEIRQAVFKGEPCEEHVFSRAR